MLYRFTDIKAQNYCRMTQKDFNKLFVSLKDKVFRFARSILSDSAAAEDITQDIFEKLWTNKLYGNKVNVESYIMTSTKNLCLDRVKHKKTVLKNSDIIRYQNNDLINYETPESEPSEIIKTIIKNLPEKQKMIIHLRDVEGYEFEEIYKITGIKQSAIRTNLSRARKSVKQEYLKIMNYGLQ